MSCFNPDLDGLFCLLVEFGLVDVEACEHALCCFQREARTGTLSCCFRERHELNSYKLNKLNERETEQKHEVLFLCLDL